MTDFKKEIGRLRSEVRALKESRADIDFGKLINSPAIEKEVNPFTGIVSGNYWTQTGMPWVSSEGRKAVLTEWFWQPIRGQPRRVDTNELRNFAQTFWVNSCVTTIMDEISACDWDIIPKDGYTFEEVTSQIEEIKDFLQTPNNNRESFTEILRALVKDILELDAGVLVKVFSMDSYDFDHLEPKSGAPLLKPRGQRKLMELYARDGASFLIESDKFGRERGYWQYSYQIPAHPMWFNKEEISYMMRNRRSMSVYGFAPTQAILDLIKSLHWSTLYNRKFFEENAIPDGALSLLDTNETEFKAFMNWWNAEFKGQPHKFVAINKDIKWQPFNITNRELEFLETQKQYYKFVISMYGLTPAELGMTDDVNKATSANQAELTKRKGIRPILKIIEEYFNEDILTEFNSEGVEFTFVYDDPAEKAAKLSNWEKEVQIGIATINEIRIEQGKAPVSWGDGDPRSSGMLSHSLSPSGGDSSSSVDEGESSSAGDEAQSGNNEDQKDQSEGKPADSKKKDKLRRYDEAEAETNELIEDPYSLANRPVGSFKGVDDGQYYHEPNQVFEQPYVLNPLTSDHRTPEDRYPSEHQYNTGSLNTIMCPVCGFNTLANATSPDDLSGQAYFRCTNCAAYVDANELLDSMVLNTLTSTVMGNPEEHAITVPKWSPKSIGDDFMDVKEYAGFDYSKSAPYIMEYANSPEYRKLLNSYLSEISAPKRQAIITVLREGIRTNKTISEIARDIEKILKDKERSNLIARTEVIRITNEGNLIRMKKQGATMVEWVSAPEDGRLCPLCKKMDGKKFPISKATGLIPQHPRCRCTLTEALEF